MSTRKFISVIVVALVLFVVIVSSVAAATAEIYPRAGRIVEIDRSEDLVTFVDGTGLLWEFYGAEDYEVGDVVACVFWDADTQDIILDDEILDVQYAGIF